jgi:hypothetical protein
LSFTLVLDVSGVTTLVGVVGDNLDSAVGKVDAVLSGGVVVVTVLVVGEDWAVVVIGDSVVEVVVGREDGVNDSGWAVGRGRGPVKLGHT